MRPTLNHRADEGIDEVVVLGPAYPVMAPSDVYGIFQQRHVIGADVEQHRKAYLGVDTSARAVQGKLADRNTHAAGSLIAEPQDAFAIADYNGADSIVAVMSQDLANPVLYLFNSLTISYINLLSDKIPLVRMLLRVVVKHDISA